MPLPTLRLLVEDHFKPKWWQLWRRQKYHACLSYGTTYIFEVPTKCMVSKDLHKPKMCAQVSADEVRPNCGDECPPIKASDPEFFVKLDEYLARECYAEDRVLKAEKSYFVATSAGPVGPVGPPGPPGPPGPASV